MDKKSNQPLCSIRDFFVATLIVAIVLGILLPIYLFVPNTVWGEDKYAIWTGSDTYTEDTYNQLLESFEEPGVTLQWTKGHYKYSDGSHYLRWAVHISPPETDFLFGIHRSTETPYQDLFLIILIFLAVPVVCYWGLSFLNMIAGPDDLLCLGGGI